MTLELIDLRNYHTLDHKERSLFRQFYDQLYSPTFRIESERDDFDVLAKLIFGEDIRHPKSRMHCLLAVDNLGNTELAKY